MNDYKDKKQFTPPPDAPVNYEFEKMLKIFTKQVEKEGILKEVKARRYHIKPSEQKRLDKKNRRK